MSMKKFNLGVIYMNQKEKSIKYFNKNAERYNESFDGRFVKCMYDELVQRVSNLEGKNILDLGCGNGNVLKRLEGRGYNLCGVDLSEKMIKEAEKNVNGKAELKIGDSENIPYEDNRFDVVICNASFHHYTNPEKALSEIKRVLKDNGTLILGDPTRSSKLYLKIINYTIKFSDGGDYKIYHKDEIKKLLNDNGFTVDNYKNINSKTFVLNAKLV